MKNILFLAALLLTTFSPILRAQDLKADMQAMGKLWQEANNSGDMKALSQMCANEVILVNPKDNSTTKVSREQMLETLTQQFSEADDQTAVVVETAETMPDGKVKIAGTATGVMTNRKTGEKTPYTAGFEHLLVQENGRWKLGQMKSWLK